jgi:transcriptional regulator with XRE-family HTH domain
MDHIGTGFDAIDDALGGLITGDNVAWICQDPDLYRILARGLAAAVAQSDVPGLVVEFDRRHPIGVTGATTIDASASSSFARPVELIGELERRVRHERPAWLIVGDLTAPARRWGLDATQLFFERVCPAMLDAGVTAYWSIDGALGRPFVEHVRQITQCLLDVRGGNLRVLKAEGRPDALQGISYQLHVDDTGLTLTPWPAGGRLARGLSAVRQQFGLTQHDLAEAAGVTPSAISQAQSGARGLSLDTIVTLADRLGISVDRLLSTGSRRTYRLARHDRSRQVANGPFVALTSDATVGVRVYLVELAGGERIAAPFDHRGVVVLAPLTGLVQAELDDDRPVLRPGDVLVVDDGAVRSLRNLRSTTARCHWMLRD